MDQLPTYHLVLRSEPSAVPAPQRLRRALKYLLRVCKLRAVSVQEVQAPAPVLTADGLPRSNPGVVTGEKPEADDAG